MSEKLELASRAAETLMRFAGRPVHERVYVGSVLGRKRPVTADDLTRAEMTQFQDAIETARERRRLSGVPKDQQAAFAAGNGTLKPNDYVHIPQTGKYQDPWDNPVSNLVGTSHYAPTPMGRARL